MKISWMAKKSNDTVLKEAHTSRALVNKIRTRQTTFFGHVMRREKLEHLITTGMMEGKRSRGKQREKVTDGLANWLGAGKVVEILKATKDRGIWKDMITNAIKHGTDLPLNLNEKSGSDQQKIGIWGKKSGSWSNRLQKEITHPKRRLFVVSFF